MVLLSLLLNILATVVFLNLLLNMVHLSLSLIISLIHSSCFFLSDVEEVIWVEESGICVLLRLVVVFCFFCGSRGVGIGDVEWGLFWFLGGNCCFIAATFASSTSGDNMVCGVSGVVLRGMGSKWKPFLFDGDPEDRIFIINWDHNCFVVDVNGIKGFSWSPSGPMELDVEVSMLDEGSKEVELIVVGMHTNEDDSIVSTQGEDGRGSKSCTGEFVVDRRHGSWG